MEPDGLKGKACPVTNECGEPAAFTPGPVSYRTGPIPISRVDDVDGEMWLAAEILWPEIWPARHNRELWLTGPDGTHGWRDQADGFYE